MKKLLIVLFIGIGIYTYVQDNPAILSSFINESVPGNQEITDAFHNRLSNIQVSGSGKVSRIFSDDNKGSRHQRFLLKLPSGQTILIAHNIDLAPKIHTIKTGDEIQFFGEYEWNSKGGVVHWTHHDPQGRHVGGWLKHDGKKYE